jgi:hypothetical protein
MEMGKMEKWKFLLSLFLFIQFIQSLAPPISLRSNQFIHLLSRPETSDEKRRKGEWKKRSVSPVKVRI